VIFDLTLLDTQETIRYKPHNKGYCRAVLISEGNELASLRSLAIASTSQASIVGGQFQLEWHRMGSNDRLPGSPIDLVVSYHHRDEAHTWKIGDIQIIAEGVPLVLAHLDEVMGTIVHFFGKEMELL
jgi:allophanate hydrolase subunit 2